LPKKLTQEKAIENIQKKCLEKEYEFRGFVGGVYVNNQIKLVLYCYKHNHEWKTTTYANFMKKERKSSCPKCAGNEKISKDEFLKLGFSPDQEFDSGVLKSYDYPCSDCGKIVKKLFNHVRNGHTRCRKCGTSIGGEKQKILKEEFLKLGFSPDQEFDSGVLKSYDYPCSDCGKIVKKLYHSVIGGKTKCKKCSCEVTSKKQRISKEKYIELGFLPNQKFENINKNYYYKCPECGKIIKKSYSHVVHSGCVLCLECSKKKLNKIEITKKMIETKHKNKTHNVSKPEEQCYQHLIQLYGESNVKRNWNKDPRYPFCVDFYIIPTDIFIECNFHWVHGKELYNSRKKTHKDKLNEWKNKNKGFYKTAINVWTVRDPLKFKTSKENKLNYLVFYTIDDFKNHFK